MVKLRDAFASWLCSGREERPTKFELGAVAWLALMTSGCMILLLRIIGALLYMNFGWKGMISVLFNDSIVGGLSVVFCSWHGGNGVRYCIT